MRTSQRLRAIDLNLLPILRQLLTDRNVTKAAEALVLSQPAVSKALARLRAIFDDALLVRDGRGMILTPRAEQLLPHVEEQCRQLEALWESEEFVPGSSRRLFKIAASDYEVLAVLPEIAPTLQQQAPFVSLSFCGVAANFGLEEWADVDLVIGPEAILPPMQDANFIKVPLMREDFVTVVGRDHPLASASAGGKVGDYRQLTLDPSSGPPRLERMMQPFSPKGAFATLPTLTLLPILALLTGSAAFVPRMAALRFAEYLPLTIIDGADMGPAVDVCLAWHRRWDNDGGHRWLRELIAACCKRGDSLAAG